MYGSSDVRRGISLLEVLISIGILSIGLVSVLTLIPAGRMQASKASAIDRTTILAMNAAADFMNRGFARPAGWTTMPTQAFAAYDPLGSLSFPTFWSGTVSGALITPRTNAATAIGTGAMTAAGIPVIDLLVRSEDDIRYTTDGLGDDDLPQPKWSISGTTGRHVYDGAYSYLATLSGTTTTWNSGEYKTLTIVTFARRDVSLPPVMLTSGADGSWTVDRTNVPPDSSLKDLVKPGSMILFQPSAGTPSWLRVLLASDMTSTTSPTTWKLGLTCEPNDPLPSGTTYVFPGAAGSTQLLIKLEGTSVWNDK